MAKTQKKLNSAPSKVIEESVLKENPDGFDNNSIVIAKQVPPPIKTRRVTFLNGRDPGVALEFHYHSATCPLKRYKLYHGKEEDLPEEVIEHLENCAETIYGYRPGPEGHPEMYNKSRKYLFSLKDPRTVRGLN
jgi:hypothetical protein